MRTVLLAALLVIPFSGAAAQQATGAVTASVTVVESVSLAVGTGTFARDRTGSYLDVTTPVRIGGRTPHLVRVESVLASGASAAGGAGAGRPERAGEVHVRVARPPAGATGVPRAAVRYLVTLIN